MMKWEKYNQQSNNYENQNWSHKCYYKRKERQNQFNLTKVRKINKNLLCQKFYNYKMSTILRWHKIIKSGIR